MICIRQYFLVKAFFSWSAHRIFFMGKKALFKEAKKWTQRVLHDIESSTKRKQKLSTEIMLARRAVRPGTNIFRVSTRLLSNSRALSAPSLPNSVVPNDLSRLLDKVITVTGPISLSAYMRQCLTNPDHGYYTTRDPLGRAGDFTTSPEISQIFGELIGLWFFMTWLEQRKPAKVNFIEFGPGKGTLMSDILRSFSIFQKKGGYSDALELNVVLIEASKVLKSKQHSQLSNSALNTDGEFWTSLHKWNGSITWVDTEKDVFDVTKVADTNYVIAHEFFDALPINKFKKTNEGWKELLVDVHSESKRFFLMESKPDVPSTSILTVDPRYTSVSVGSSVEVCPQSYSYAKDIGTLISRNGTDSGGALIIDYGPKTDVPSDTLRGIKNHKFVNPLENPGEVDLSADVDFQAIIEAATGSSPVKALGPIEQGDWLLQMGIQYRAEQLVELAKSQKEVDLIVSSYHRLVGKDDDSMGKSYKFLGLVPEHSTQKHGFDL